MHTTKRLARYFLLLASAGVLTGCGLEAPYPNREIEFIIPFPPGGPTDTAVRIIQPKMSHLLGVPITLINRTGAGGERWERTTWPSPAPMDTGSLPPAITA